MTAPLPLRPSLWTTPPATLPPASAASPTNRGYFHFEPEAIEPPLRRVLSDEPAEPEEYLPGRLRSAKRDAEDRRNPRRLARAVRAAAFVRPVVEAADEMAEDGRDETRRRTVGDEPKDATRNGNESLPVGELLEHRPEAGEVIDRERVRRGSERDVRFGPGEKARAFEATERRANALLPCPGRVSQLREREARLATGLHPAASRNGEMTREVDPQVGELCRSFALKAHQTIESFITEMRTNPPARF